MIKQHVKLSDTDRHYLQERLSKGQLGAREFKRATGLLELDRGKTLRAVAETLGVSRLTVGVWRDGYQREGLQALRDKPRSGRPIEITGNVPRLLPWRAATPRRDIAAGICDC